MRNLVLLIGLLGLAACSSLTPTNDPVYLRITDIEARLLRIERNLENESLITLAQDIASLRNEVRTLLGEVENLSFELESQSERQLDLYVDLDERLSALEDAQSRISVSQLAPSPGQVGQFGQFGQAGQAVSDEAAYNSAFALIQQQNWAGAEAAFRSFLATYPQSSTYSSNAQYWLAETRYARLDFAGALAEFQRVVDIYPQSDKMRDALLKVGFCNHELGNLDAARQALLRVIREFPGTTAATNADQRLRQISAQTG